MSRMHAEYRESQRAWIDLDFGLFAAETTVTMNEVHFAMPQIAVLEFLAPLSEEEEEVVVEGNG